MITTVRVFARSAPAPDERSLGEVVGARCPVPVIVTRGDHAQAIRELRFILEISRPSRGNRKLASLLDDVTSLTCLCIAEEAAERADVRLQLFEAALGVARATSGFVELDSRDGRSHTFHTPDGKRFYRL
ncbi:MAG: hypothetical protein SFX73_01870 [Kofleriaceae bacterium]|nr:hypothetical protein [Kofleriaceae bacterium]